MFKKVLLITGLMFLQTTTFANISSERIFLKKDLEIALEKHLVCIHDNLEKIITKEKMAKLNDNFYDLNNKIERYNFINEKTSYINNELCKKYTGYVVTILENMGSREEDIKDWETNYSKIVLRTEITDVIKFKKGKEYKNDFYKNNENEKIDKEINLYNDLMLKEDKENNNNNNNNKDISYDTNIFKD